MKVPRTPIRQKPGLLPPGLLQRAAWIMPFLILALIAIQQPFFSLAIILAILVRRGAVRMASSRAYGSARFASFDDLKIAGMVGKRGLILGRASRPTSLRHALIRLFTAPLADSREVCQYLRCALSGRRDPDSPLIRLKKSIHGLVCAPPGAGKGISFVIPALLSHHGSVVAIDPKGELFAATARVRRRCFGHRVVRLDPFSVCGPGGAKINPLDFIDPKSPMVGEQCAALADALIVQTGVEADPHWNDSARNALKAGILYVSVYAAPLDRTLSTVADLLTDPDAFSGMVAMMRDETGDLKPISGHLLAYRSLQRFGNAMAAWQDRELSSILSSVGRHLSWLHSPLIEEHLSESDFDPRDLTRANVTVYLILPPKHLATLSRLLRLWITTLYGAITEGGPQEEREVLFLLDEAGNLGGPMPSLYQAITLGRGYGVRVWLILQSLGQFKTLFPKDGEHQSAEASIDHRLVFGVRDYATAEAVSNYLGTATVGVMSQTTNRGSTESGSLGGALFGNEKCSRSTNQGTSETRSEIGRKLLFPDEILQLPPDAAIIMAKGVPPVLAKLAPYFETPELADLMPYVGKTK